MSIAIRIDDFHQVTVIRADDDLITLEAWYGNPAAPDSEHPAVLMYTIDEFKRLVESLLKTLIQTVQERSWSGTPSREGGLA